MKCLVVISLDMPDPENVAEVLQHIYPPSIPYFDNQVRVVVGTDVRDTIRFLDEG